MNNKIKLKVAHSPDSDDAFMFYAIREQKFNLENFEFEFSTAEIEILNQKAFDEDSAPDIIAASFHAYAYLEDKFDFLSSGCSMGGSDYGPRLVSKPQTNTNLSQLKIAVPGKLTSAYLALRLYERLELKSDQEFLPVFCKFDEVFELLETDQVDASLLIHESQLKFQDNGYKLLLDLGAWWFKYSQGLNLPLGTNLIKKKLGSETRKKINQLLKQSIIWGKNNFAEVQEFSRKFANNDLDDTKAQNYLDMYVNESTIELSSKDHESINLFLELGQREQLIKKKNIQ